MLVVSRVFGEMVGVAFVGALLGVVGRSLVFVVVSSGGLIFVCPVCWIWAVFIPVVGDGSRGLLSPEVGFGTVFGLVGKLSFGRLIVFFGSLV